mmetsp:Transcript_13122/g.30788  ORF Transcript_13122/g.30788 Transcript_13122/m.30788 type:complete len:169 (+) Transcript_13122:42-548(+)
MEAKGHAIPGLPLAQAPVKNTFIHYEDSAKEASVQKCNSDPLPSSASECSCSIQSESEKSSQTRADSDRSGIGPGIQWSEGARLHPEQCKPCAWNWKPSGCSKGEKCAFCHMCAEGELKRKRKEHINHLRQQRNKQEAAVAGSSHAPRQRHLPRDSAARPRGKHVISL